jgi:hypothetical protein
MGICTNLIQSAIAQAVLNGVISVGDAPLSATQIAYITQITGDSKAWQQIQTIGYWFNVTFTSSVNSAGKTVWQANYIIVYAKENVVNKVVGSHILI